MIDYKKYINALRKCAKEHKNDKTPLGHVIVSDLCRDTANLLEEVEQESKTGHWIRVTDKAGYLVWECDKCGWQQRYNTNFCPDCGAKMVEPQESEDKE